MTNEIRLSTFVFTKDATTLNLVYAKRLCVRSWNIVMIIQLFMSWFIYFSSTDKFRLETPAR